MEKLKNLDLNVLKALLKNIKLYKSLKRQLGVRGVDKFKRDLNSEDLFVVEYFSSIDENDAFSKASEVYKKVFNTAPNKESINFIKKDGISGGIKVYKNDSMVDLSFSKVEKFMIS